MGQMLAVDQKILLHQGFECSSPRTAPAALRPAGAALAIKRIAIT